MRVLYTFYSQSVRAGLHFGNGNWFRSERRTFQSEEYKIEAFSESARCKYKKERCFFHKIPMSHRFDIETVDQQFYNY